MTPVAVLAILLRPVKDGVYILPLGLPVYWRNEITGKLVDAVESVMKYKVVEAPAPTQEQIDLVIKYIRYFIKAPCWSDVGELSLSSLRELAESLRTQEDIYKFIDASMELGLDPF